MKYSLSPQEIPWAPSALQMSLGSGYISSYVPPIVIVQIEYTLAHFLVGIYNIYIYQETDNIIKVSFGTEKIS